MTKIRFAMLTGDSNTGKSTVCKEVCSESEIQHLASDGEIMRRIFDLLPQEKDKKLHE